MPRKKYNYDIEQVEFTHVQSGDTDNKAFYSYFSGNRDKAKKQLDQFLVKDAVSITVQSIFNGDISDDQFRRITTLLTCWDAILSITNTSADVTANDLFFALLVNWNAGKGNGTNKIRSYAALQSAKASAVAAGNGLDYREYIVNGEGEGKFNNDYVTIVISPKEFGSKMAVNLPIIPMKLGLFRLCSERVPAYMTIVGDPDNTSHTIPPHLWLTMVADGMSRRITTKFSKLEGKHLAKLIDADQKYIDEILEMNDFRTVYNFLDFGEMEFDDNGSITLVGTEEPPEIENVSGFEWVEMRKMTYFLKCADFYLVEKKNGAVNILAQR